MKNSFFLLIFSIMGLFVSAQTIEKTYHIDNPSIIDIQDYKQIDLKDCMQSALAGQPSLPWHSVSLLLPQGTEAQFIDVVCSDFTEVRGFYDLFPYQPCRTYNNPERKEFLKDESVYSSKSIYPYENHGVLTTSYMNGYAFAISSFTPVQYIPAEGKVMIAKSVTIRVSVKAAKDNHFEASSRPETISRVKTLAQNPEMIDSYTSRGKSSDDYELLVITPRDYVEKFNDYIEFYYYHGLRTRIVSVESIYETMDGRDDSEKIRNYIIQEYENHDIMMVLLGGDVAFVPYRGLYCDVLSGGSHSTDNNIPADLYFAALDGTWNDNNNDKWGEIGEDDLLPEIGVARFPFNNENQLNNLKHKTITYQQAPVLGEFRKVILGGELLHEATHTNGSDYLELLIGNHDDNGYSTVGIPEDYDFIKLYNEEGNWSGGNLREAINNGTGYVHHAGHANSDYVAGWNGSSITESYFAGANGVDHNYTFFHTHGCDCGNFPSNCIMEKLVTIPTFAVSVMGNSRYGWFNEGQTEGPSCHLQREMTDAFWAERIPYLGLAMTEGKCQTAPWVTAPGQFEEGALRWNFYDLNILGDVAVSPWHDEPFTAKVDYEPALLQGATSMRVAVSHKGEPLRNFRCNLFHNEALLGYGITDENGIAIVELYEPIDFVEQMTLAVTGMNSHPVTLYVEGINDNVPFIYPNSMIINDYQGNNNGRVDFGEIVNFDLEMINYGTSSASDLSLMLSCCNPDYIRINDYEDTLDNIESLDTLTVSKAFEITVDDDAPNNTSLSFSVLCSDGVEFWRHSFAVKINAPELKVISADVDDSQGNNNGIIEQGETIKLIVKGKNIGGCDATDTKVKLNCSTAGISIPNEAVEIGDVIAGENFTAQITFTVADYIPNGTTLDLEIQAMSNKYIDNNTFTYTVGYVFEGFETGDFSYIDWDFSGDNDWIISEESYEGSYCARSGEIDDDQISSMIVRVKTNQDGEMSFFLKTSTEKGKDYLAFFIDNKFQNWWSGENNWQQISYNLSKGEHLLEWRYDKSPSGVSGFDCAWLDNIKFPANAIILLGENEIINSQEDIVIYPNPNDGRFIINLPKDNCQIKIYSLSGQIVYQADNLSNTSSIDLGEIKAGMYFINVNNGKKEVFKKIIIR